MDPSHDKCLLVGDMNGAWHGATAAGTDTCDVLVIVWRCSVLPVVRKPLF